MNWFVRFNREKFEVHCKFVSTVHWCEKLKKNKMSMDYYDGAGYKVEDMHYFDVYVPSVMEVWESCMRPSIVQIVQYMATFFLWNIAFRLTSQTGESFMPFMPIQYMYSSKAFSFPFALAWRIKWPQQLTSRVVFSTLHQSFAAWLFHISHWAWTHYTVSDSPPSRTYYLSPSLAWTWNITV